LGRAARRGSTLLSGIILTAAEAAQRFTTEAKSVYAELTTKKKKKKKKNTTTTTDI
jgi:hypothetical protein